MKEDPHLLTLTWYPVDTPWRWDWYEITNPAGEIIFKGPFPLDHDAVREACEEYHKKVDAEIYSKEPFKKL